MFKAVKDIFQTHSRAFKHDYLRSLLVVDIDITGLPCGSQAEYALKGYQAGCGIRYGRQLCRALAAQYEEVIIDLLFPGNFQMKHTLEETIKRVEQVLEISECLKLLVKTLRINIFVKFRSNFCKL